MSAPLSDPESPPARTCVYCKATAEQLGPIGMWQHCPEHEGGSLTHEWVEPWPAPPRPPEPSDPIRWAAIIRRLHDQWCQCGIQAGMRDLDHAKAMCDAAYEIEQAVEVVRQDEREKAAKDWLAELNRYGRHDSNCQLWRRGTLPSWCSCGFSAVIVRGGGK